MTALFSKGPISATGRHVAPPVQFDAGCVTGALFTGFTAATYHVHLVEVEVQKSS